MRPESASPVPVLFFHHVGAFGGSSRSLLELATGFPEGAVLPRVVTKRGNVAPFFTRAGIEVLEVPGLSQFDNTQWGHYRGKRWLILMRELWYLPSTFLAVRRARQRWPDTQIVHVNESVQLATIILSKVLLRRPVVVHVRSVQDTRHSRLRSRFFAWVLRHYADSVITIDETVRSSLPPRISAEVIHNSYSPGNVRTGPGSETVVLPPRRPELMRVAIVGHLVALKGMAELMEAMKLCHERRVAVEFVFVGANARRSSGLAGKLLRAFGFAHNMEDELSRFVDCHGLDGMVRKIEFTPEIDRIYSNVDVLCFPSQLDAVGRPVFEAAFWKVPSVVAISKPKPDTFIHGETGLGVPPRDPEALADAICYFQRKPEEIKRMGEAAYRLAVANFSARGNARKVLAIYQQLLGDTTDHIDK
jgi:glycosyltransferase involved in cell wall biosynthesis